MFKVFCVNNIMCLTTDMWTSRAGNGYISLTTHSVLPTFEMTNLIPGEHDHTHIAEALQSATEEWGIDLPVIVTAFVTYNGCNIVKCIEDDLHILRVPCAGHALNLGVQAALKEPRLTTILARCRKTVQHFNKSRLDSEDLTAKQDLLGVPKHKLTQKVTTRWNLTHDMIIRLCKQQPAIVAVLNHRRDLLHLECSSQEWRVLEDLADLLSPFKQASEYLSGEKYLIISAVSPLLSAIKEKIEPSENDLPIIREVKKKLAADLDKRYNSPDLVRVLNVSSYLDPRFKMLSHLPDETREECAVEVKRLVLKLMCFDDVDITERGISSYKYSSPSSKQQTLIHCRNC